VTLRTTAIIAGVLGLLMLIAGLVANDARADREVVTTEALQTPVVVVGPEVLALEGLSRISVTSDGAVEAHSARTVDATAWLKRHSSTYVVGYDGWDDLATRTESRVVAPSPSPSPSPTPSDSDAAVASPEPTDASATAEDDALAEVDNGSADDWRESWNGVDRVSLAVAAVASGETLVVYSEDGSDLTNVEFTTVRQVNDGWISPLILIGGALAALGAFAALSGIIDTRPVQAKIEAWSRRRSTGGAHAEAPPGSRRERRLAGSTVPTVALDESRVVGPPESALLTTHAWDIEPPSRAQAPDARTEWPTDWPTAPPTAPPTEAPTKDEGGAL